MIPLKVVTGFRRRLSLVPLIRGRLCSLAARSISTTKNKNDLHKACKTVLVRTHVNGFYRESRGVLVRSTTLFAEKKGPCNWLNGGGNESPEASEPKIQICIHTLSLNTYILLGPVFLVLRSRVTTTPFIFTPCSPPSRRRVKKSFGRPQVRADLLSPACFYCFSSRRRDSCHES